MVPRRCIGPIVKCEVGDFVDSYMLLGEEMTSLSGRA
jgi:hypothetical protein